MANEIIVCVVQHEGKILLLKRTAHHEHDPHKWEFVSGLLKTPVNKTFRAQEQIELETGLSPEFVKHGTPFEVEDKYGKWKVHPFLFNANSSQVRVKMDDHVQYRWIKKNELGLFECVKDLHKNLEALQLV